MLQESYRTAVTVAAAPEEVYAAVNDVRRWWSQEVDGDNGYVGAEFVFHGHDDAQTVEHVSRIRVEELVPGERVVWRVLENSMSFVADQSEWVGSTIRFELAPLGNGTEVTFTHLGLVPSFECYEACSGAWSFFVLESLRDLVERGAGAPIATREVSA